MDIWEWSVVSPRCPGVVGRFSRMSAVVGRPSRLSGVVGRPSQMSGSCREVLRVVREWAKTLPKSRSDREALPVVR